ncbi:MAG: hypothetical protein IPK01_09600 [Acidobacteria bacterium]|nr:hypothetical protein [Acidobacteriota bacterium]
MNRVKLVTLSVFAVLGIAFFLMPLKPDKVSGRMLSEAIGSPTNVDASDNSYVEKIQIHWDTVRGATLYRIFRNTVNNAGGAADVGTTAANYFFDTPPSAGTNYFYWVRAENGGTVSELSLADQGRRAVGTVQPSPFGLLEPPNAPTGNPITAAKAYLGKTIFWDEQLSSTKTVSCGTCHRPAAGGSDPRTVIGDSRSTNAGPDNTFNTGDDISGSPGVPQNNINGTYTSIPLFGINPQVTGRKSPTYLNGAYTRQGLFWDGRATDIFRDQITNSVLLTEWASLESQSAGPPLSSAEMAHGGRTWLQVASQIESSKPLALATRLPNGLKSWIANRTYPQLFQEAFGTPEVTPSRIAMAVATHERTLFSDRTPLDLAIQNIQPLTLEEQDGQTVFVDMNCNACHGGPLLSDNNYHNIGVRPQNEDIGRGAVTGLVEDNGRFKTPTLRNVSLRGPFFHNGRKENLEDVIELYRRGGDFSAPNIDPDLIHPLNLTNQQRSDLAAFMRRPLTDPRVANERAPFDRPRLYTESVRVPVITGIGRAGAGAIVPIPTAIEPPLLGNPSFTVAVSRGLGGAPAVLVIDSNDPGVGSAVPSTGSFARVTIDLAGTGNGGGWGSVKLSIRNDLALVGRTFYGRWYITDAAAANGFSVTPAFSFSIFSSSNLGTVFDFDGDNKSDVSIYRPNGGSGGEWWWSRSSNGGNGAVQFGTATDVIVPSDFTGDNKTDIAFFRPSTGFWYVLRSDDFSFFAFPFGSGGDVPVPADYDADGRSDPAVFRPSNSTWFIANSGGGTAIQQFGIAGDLPVPADYDGDAKADIAIYRPSLGQWWLARSSAGTVAFEFGTATDKAVSGDYTGDGKADVAFWRPATGDWYILRSENNSYFAFPFGIASDLPVPGDYDGDGKYDAAVFRPSNSTWFAQRSTAGTLIQQFGQIGDIPLPNAFVR